jgi:hypothetical protein
MTNALMLTWTYPSHICIQSGRIVSMLSQQGDLSAIYCGPRDFKTEADRLDYESSYINLDSPKEMTEADRLDYESCCINIDSLKEMTEADRLDYETSAVYFD